MEAKGIRGTAANLGRLAAVVLPELSDRFDLGLVVAVVPGGSRTGAVGVFPFRLGGQPEFTIGEHVSLFTKGDSLTMAHRIHWIG